MWRGGDCGSDSQQSESVLAKIRTYVPSTCGNKQAAALALLSGMSKDREADCGTIIMDGANGFSTFYGFYMLDALVGEGAHAEAMDGSSPI